MVFMVLQAEDEVVHHEACAGGAQDEETDHLLAQVLLCLLLLGVCVWKRRRVTYVWDSTQDARRSREQKDTIIAAHQWHAHNGRDADEGKRCVGCVLHRTVSIR